MGRNNAKHLEQHGNNEIVLVKNIRIIFIFFKLGLKLPHKLPHKGEACFCYHHKAPLLDNSLVWSILADDNRSVNKDARRFVAKPFRRYFFSQYFASQVIDFISRFDRIFFRDTESKRGDLLLGSLIFRHSVRF